MINILNYVYWGLVVFTSGKMTLNYEGGWTLAVAIFAPMIVSYVLGFFTAKQN